jgi:hypothetical protein
MRALSIVFASSVLLAPLASRADDVVDEIKEALSAYQNQDLATALAALDAATSLMRQQRADAWKAFLPAPPAGWTADDAQVSTAGPVMFGGGTGASRQYRKGDQRVDVTVLTDSPLLQGVGAVLSNIATATGGARVLVLKGHRMVYLKDDNSFTALIADKVMVKVAGSVATSEDSLRQFISLIDFAGLEKFAH